MTKTKQPLVLFGDSQFAEIAWEYFTEYTDYEVVAFSVPYELKDKFTFHGLPVVDFEEVEDLFPPETHKGFVSVAFSKLNRNREHMFNEAQFKGYDLVSFVHPNVFIAKSHKIGKNVFIFENNVIQSFVEIDDGVVAWSGNHFGHGSKIGKFAFVSSHVVISGNCSIGPYSFLGVNSTISDGIKIGSNVVVGAGSLIVKDLPDNSLVKGKADFPEPGIDTLEKFGVK